VDNKDRIKNYIRFDVTLFCDMVCCELALFYFFFFSKYSANIDTPIPGDRIAIATKVFAMLNGLKTSWTLPKPSKYQIEITPIIYNSPHITNHILENHLRILITTITSFIIGSRIKVYDYLLIFM